MDSHPPRPVVPDEDIRRMGQRRRHAAVTARRDAFVARDPGDVADQSNCTSVAATSRVPAALNNIAQLSRTASQPRIGAIAGMHTFHPVAGKPQPLHRGRSLHQVVERLRSAPVSAVEPSASLPSRAAAGCCGHRARAVAGTSGGRIRTRREHRMPSEQSSGSREPSRLSTIDKSGLEDVSAGRREEMSVRCEREARRCQRPGAVQLDRPALFAIPVVDIGVWHGRS